jgi:hypothetical protein
MQETLIRWWRTLRGRHDEEFAEFSVHSQAYDPEWRELLLRYVVRITVAFVVLFGAVFFAFRWSGAAVRFGAQRASGQAVPTWRVRGVVRDSQTLEPIPWARIEDDPAGRPPLFFTEADYAGSYELLTLAEPHRIRVSAPNYRTAVALVGRTWYLWIPHGNEGKDLILDRETFNAPK